MYVYQFCLSVERVCQVCKTSKYQQGSKMGLVPRVNVQLLLSIRVIIRAGGIPS